MFLNLELYTVYLIKICLNTEYINTDILEKEMLI